MGQNPSQAMSQPIIVAARAKHTASVGLTWLSVSDYHYHENMIMIIHLTAKDPTHFLDLNKVISVLKVSGHENRCLPFVCINKLPL